MVLLSIKIDGVTALPQTLKSRTPYHGLRDSAPCRPCVLVWSPFIPPPSWLTCMSPLASSWTQLQSCQRPSYSGFPLPRVLSPQFFRWLTPSCVPLCGHHPLGKAVFGSVLNHQPIAHWPLYSPFSCVALVPGWHVITHVFASLFLICLLYWNAGSGNTGTLTILVTVVFSVPRTLSLK